MSGYRRAAVALHGLSKNDQEWILAKLHDSARQRLMNYLAELNDLGFADEAFSTKELNIPLGETAPGSSDSAVLSGAVAAEIFLILKNEPSSLIGRLLTIRKWPWENSLLQMFSVSRQERIRTFMRQDNRTPPALRVFLVAALAERLQSNSTNVKASRLLESRSILQHIFFCFSLPFSWMVKSWSR